MVRPLIGKLVAEHPRLKPIVRTGMVPALVISTLVVYNTPAEKIVVAGLLVLVTAVLAVVVTK
jgi:hypothetical protein